MKRIATYAVIALLAFASALCAQTLSLIDPAAPTATSITIAPNTAKLLALNFSDAPTSVAMVGVEYVLSLPTGWSASQTIGPQGSAALKTLSSNGNKGVVYGVYGGVPNQTPIPSGLLVTVNVPGTATLGTYSVGLRNVMGVNVASDGVGLVAGPDLQIVVANPPVYSKYDLNKDGKVDGADEDLAVRQDLGKDPCGSADVNADGKCNVADIQLIHNEWYNSIH